MKKSLLTKLIIGFCICNFKSRLDCAKKKFLMHILLYLLILITIQFYTQAMCRGPLMTRVPFGTAPQFLASRS
jgi:hypothetical protein